MLWFLIIVAVVAVGFVAFRMRASILAKVLGQPQSRIERQLNQRKK